VTASQGTLVPGLPGPGPEPPATATAGLLAALMAHYRPPGAARGGCILVTEAEAPGTQRRCDLIHVGVASRGSGIDGHELKATRADWLRELSDQAKADAWWPYCTRWWIVAPPGVVRDGELPEGWGLMEPRPRGRRFRVRVPAAAKEPMLTVALMAELLRRADNERLGQIDTLRQRHREQLWMQAEELCAGRAGSVLDQATLARLRVLEMVEEALGMHIDQFPWISERPITQIKPAELAAALAGMPGQVAAQRLLASVQQQRDALRAAARRLLATLEEPGG
jgi:hypothetical protein